MSSIAWKNDTTVLTVNWPHSIVVQGGENRNRAAQTQLDYCTTKYRHSMGNYSHKFLSPV